MESPTPAPAGHRAPPPVVLGLLGGIGSGKSSVARVLAEAGAAWLDADALAHRALDAPDVVAALVARHGAKVVAGGDPPRVDRAALGRLVFGSDPGQRSALVHLESLLHPRVRRDLEERLEQHLTRRDVPAVLLDVPLLLESSPLAHRCDLLLFVDCDQDERARRVLARRGWSRDELARRDALQMPLAEKRAHADIVLANRGDEAQLRQEVARWLAAAGGFTALPRRRSA